MSYDLDKVIIIEPSKELFDLFGKIKQEILTINPDLVIELTGALSVPMKGKKEMDILIQTNNVQSTQNKLIPIGFSKGPINNGEGFCRNRKYEVIIELHILPFNHKKIKLYRQITKTLQEDKNLRKSFEALKTSLNGKNIKEYKDAKKIFMKENNLIS